MCKSSDLPKALAQYLLTSDELSIGANIVGSLYLVSHNSRMFVKSDHRELNGNFVAPDLS